MSKDFGSTFQAAYERLLSLWRWSLLKLPYGRGWPWRLSSIVQVFSVAKRSIFNWNYHHFCEYNSAFLLLKPHTRKKNTRPKNLKSVINRLDTNPSLLNESLPHNQFIHSTKLASPAWGLFVLHAFRWKWCSGRWLPWQKAIKPEAAYSLMKRPANHSLEYIYVLKMNIYYLCLFTFNMPREFTHHISKLMQVLPHYRLHRAYSFFLTVCALLLKPHLRPWLETIFTVQLLICLFTCLKAKFAGPFLLISMQPRRLCLI